MKTCLVGITFSLGLFLHQLPLDAELIARYSLDEIASSTVAFDSAGNSNGPFHGSYQGAPNLNVAGVLGSAMASASAASHVEVANTATQGLFSGNEPRSVSVWFSANSIVTQGRLVGAGFGPAGSFDITLEDDASAGDGLSLGLRIGLRYGNGNMFWSAAQAGITLDDGNFHHVAVTYDGSTLIGDGGLKVYLDGQLVTRDGGNNNNSGQILNTDNGFWIARDVTGIRGHRGVVDEVRIFNHALTEIEVEQLASLERLGDVNLDGQVDLSDVAPFIERVTNGVYQFEADMNQDEEVDLLDVNLFVETLVGSDPLPQTFDHRVTFGGETVTVNFQKFSNRGENFALMEQQLDGSFLELSPRGVRTYIGTVEQYPGAIASGIRRENGTILARVTFEDGIEWIDRFLEVNMITAAPVVPSLPDYVVREGGAGSDVHAIELGVDLAHDQFVVSGGTSHAALEMAEYSAMTINALYLRDAAILHLLERVYVRRHLEHDPYIDVSSQLAEVRDQWENVLPAGNHDLAMLVLHSFPGGVAYSGGGVGTSIGYSVNGSDSLGDFTSVGRHELGHNWSMNHFDGGSPEGQTINSGNRRARMSGPELELLLQHRDQQISFIDQVGAFDFSLPPRASDDRITVIFPGVALVSPLENDHDSNGSKLAIADFDTKTLNGRTVVKVKEFLLVEFVNVDFEYDNFSYQVIDDDGMTSSAIVHFSNNGTFAGHVPRHSAGASSCSCQECRCIDD